MVLNCKKLLLFFLLIISFSLYAENKKISLFYEKNEEMNETEDSVIMYLFYCFENESNISDCDFICDYDFTKQSVSQRVLLNKNEAFYLCSFEDKKLKMDFYDKKGNLLSSANFDLEQCSSLEELNLIKEEIYNQIQSDKSLISTENILLKQKDPEKKIESSNKEKKLNHDFPYISLSLSGVSFHLYYEDLNNFSIFPINFMLSFYPLRYMEMSFFYNLSYKDFYLDTSIGEMASFAQFYGMSLGFSFFYKQGHYSFGASFYNISAIVEKSSTLKCVESYFLPQFSFYQRLDIKLYKMIHYTMYANLHTVQRFSNEDGVWIGKMFDYNLPRLDVSLLGISVFF
jgi:hypothetical protein